MASSPHRRPGHGALPLHDEEKGTPPPPTSPPPKPRLFPLMLTFFLAMIIEELTLEAVSKAFPDLDSLASAVTLSQFGFCFSFPLCLSRGRVLRSFPKSFRELLPYIKLSGVVLSATMCATRSIAYVSYPTKVVFKSAKLIPTMILSSFIRGSRYGVLEYLAAVLLCAGAAGYGYRSGGAATNSKFGIFLLVVSVCCDALVPNLQQRLMGFSGKGHDVGLSAQALMVNVNAVGFLALLVFMAGEGMLWSVLSASVQRPSLIGYLLVVGLTTAIAVLAYTRLIKASGSVVAVAVATLRKVATVLLSYVVFPKPLLRIHVISGGLVLAGVVVNTYERHRKR